MQRFSLKLIHISLRLSFIIVVCLLLSSCYKEKFTTDQNDSLSFSTDTLSFDTVLTSISTVTRYFKVYNTHDLSIRIEEVKLTGANAGFFNLNVDGLSG